MFRSLNAPSFWWSEGCLAEYPHLSGTRAAQVVVRDKNPFFTRQCKLSRTSRKKEVCLVIERVIYVLPMTVSFAHILLLDRCSSLCLRGNWEMLSPGQFHITIGAQFVVWHLIEPSFWHAPWNSVSHRTRPEHLDQWRAQKDINRSIVVNPKIKPVAATSWNMLLQPKPVDQSWSR